MSRGAPALNRVNKQSQSGPPFVPTSADNGLSVDTGTGRIVLGGPVGTPSALLNGRDILPGAFKLRFVDAAVPAETLSLSATLLQIISTAFNSNVNFSGAGISVGDVGTTLGTSIGKGQVNVTAAGNDISCRLEPDILSFDSMSAPATKINLRAAFGSLQVMNVASVLKFNMDILTGDFVATGSLTIGSATLITTTVAFTNGAAALAGTLLNAPAAGNPSKWIPINDNGTTRFIPAW
jgi:hypothetical protein